VGNLSFNGTAWAFVPTTSFTAGGDLTGTSTNQVVSKLQGSTLNLDGISVFNVGSVIQYKYNPVTHQYYFGYGPVDLSNPNSVTNNLSVSDGGTGVSSIAQNQLVVGNGSSAITTLAPGTSGYVVTSNGTSFYMAPSSSSSSVTFAGDLAGDDTSQKVVQITGATGNIMFSPSNLSPVIGQVQATPDLTFTTQLQIAGQMGAAVGDPVDAVRSL